MTQRPRSPLGSAKPKSIAACCGQIRIRCRVGNIDDSIGGCRRSGRESALSPRRPVGRMCAIPSNRPEERAADGIALGSFGGISQCLMQTGRKGTQFFPADISRKELRPRAASPFSFLRCVRRDRLEEPIALGAREPPGCTVEHFLQESFVFGGRGKAHVSRWADARDDHRSRGPAAVWRRSEPAPHGACT